jgi:hypothetical protein
VRGKAKLVLVLWECIRGMGIFGMPNRYGKRGFDCCGRNTLHLRRVHYAAPLVCRSRGLQNFSILLRGAEEL